MFLEKLYLFFPFLHLNPNHAIALLTAEVSVSPRVLHPAESSTDSQGLGVA